MKSTLKNADSATGVARSNTAGRSAALASAWLIASALFAVPAADAATAGALSASDEKCLTCHSMPVLSKTLVNGEKLSLHISKDEFASSVHSMMGCGACHRDIDPAKHPAMSSIESMRDYAVAKAQVCRTCHAGQYKQYEGSIHGQLVAEGEAGAPVCSSCHDVHAVRARTAAETGSGNPCQTCHQDIFDAYAGSVHGKARVDSGHVEAPICVDCHQAHDVAAVATTGVIKTECLGCHEDAPKAHDKWLSNSRLHLNSIACPACHSPAADRSVDLMLYDNVTREFITEPRGDPRFEKQVRAIDTAGDGLDARELWTLVRAVNREGEDTDITLRGRLEVLDGAQAHQLAPKLQAVRQCDTCHHAGAAPFEQVTISVAGPDGRRIKYAAGEETLNSAVSVDSVSGFYTAGGTRIKALDYLLILGVLAGLAFPVIHYAARKYFKTKR